MSCIAWNLQSKYFSEEFNMLQRSKHFRGNLKNLGLFLQRCDNFELVRVGGRLEHANIPDSQKHQILLPKNDHFVNQYVRYVHLINFHASPKTLVALSRLQFWIVNAKNVACRIVRSCEIARFYSTKSWVNFARIGLSPRDNSENSE